MIPSHSHMVASSTAPAIEAVCHSCVNKCNDNITFTTTVTDGGANYVAAAQKLGISLLFK